MTVAGPIELSALPDAREVPTPPGAALRVLEIKNDPEAGVNDLVQAVSQDPALAAKILSTANSPTYRRGDEVTSVDRAIGILGFRSVTTISLAFSVASTMPADGVVAGIPMTSFWSRSVVTAATARLISSKVHPALAEEAFFVGLVAGLGRVVLGLVAPEQYEPLATSAAGWPTFEAEREAFGFSSAEATAALLRHWKMPELFADGAEGVEKVAPTPGVFDTDADRVARIAMLATDISAFYVDAGDGEDLREIIAFAHQCGLAADAVDGLLDEVFAHIEELAAQFNVSSDIERYGEIVSEARAQLVEITLQTDAAWHEERERREALEVENRTLEAEARQDPLTGLCNRRAFVEQFDQQINLRVRGATAMPKPMGVILIDLDHFKSVNDTHGHDVGDIVLKKVADVLRMTTRTEETVARYGGEEFILLAPLATAEEIVQAAERIRRTLELIEVELPEGPPLTVTASFGAAVIDQPRTRDDGVQLIKAADEALYESKETGRNKVTLSRAELG